MDLPRRPPTRVAPDCRRVTTSPCPRHLIPTSIANGVSPPQFSRSHELNENKQSAFPPGLRLRRTDVYAPVLQTGGTGRLPGPINPLELVCGTRRIWRRRDWTCPSVDISTVETTPQLTRTWWTFSTPTYASLARCRLRRHAFNWWR